MLNGVSLKTAVNEDLAAKDKSQAVCPIQNLLQWESISHSASTLRRFTTATCEIRKRTPLA